MQIRNSLVSLRDMLLSFMFSAMSNPSWLSWFRASPVSIFNKASLGLVSLVLMGIQCYFFYHAVNKNFEAWLNTFSAVFSTGLTSVATYGELIATFLGLSFAAGLWIFLAGLMLSCLNQMINASINLCRAIHAERGSSQRLHYLQAAIQQSFNASYLAITITALVCSFLIPVNPLLISIACLAVVAFGLCNIAWRFGSTKAKEQIKQSIGLAMPEQDIEKKHDFTLSKAPALKTLFSSTDLMSSMIPMSYEARQAYLQLKIDEKYKSLQKNTTGMVKIENKIKLLELLRTCLESHKEIALKPVIAKNYPGVFQSFWREKGDVEQLYDAMLYHLSHSKSMENQPKSPKL